MNTTTEDKQAKVNVIEKCWGYLRDNFHKFNDTNKIKIALALCTKDMPEKVIGEGFDTNIYNIIGQLQRDIQKNSGTSLELDARSSIHLGRTRQEPSDKEISKQGISQGSV